MRLFTKSLLGAILLVSASASAETVIVPGASGHYVPPLLGGNQNDWFYVINNAVCGKLVMEKAWDTPIILPNFTGGEVDVYQTRTNGISSAKSNTYSSTEQGEIYEWSGAKTTNSYVGDITVPTNGTLFGESLLNDVLTDTEGCIYQFRAEY